MRWKSHVRFGGRAGETHPSKDGQGAPARPLHRVPSDEGRVYLAVVIDAWNRQVIGQSNKDAGEPATEPVRIKNLVATILHTLFDVGELRIVPGAPREVAQTMTSWQPIPGVLA